MNLIYLICPLVSKYKLKVYKTSSASLIKISIYMSRGYMVLSISIRILTFKPTKGHLEKPWPRLINFKQNRSFSFPAIRYFPFTLIPPGLRYYINWSTSLYELKWTLNELILIKKFGINIILLILNSNVWGQNSNSLTLTIPQKRGLWIRLSF